MIKTELENGFVVQTTNGKTVIWFSTPWPSVRVSVVEKAATPEESSKMHDSVVLALEPLTPDTIMARVVMESLSIGCEPIRTRLGPPGRQ